MPTENPLLKVEHLSKNFGDNQPLKNIDCAISQGEVISVIGPSGAGKSTFLRCLNRLEKPSGGKIYFHGEEITDEPRKVNEIRQKIGMVFQSFHLFSHMNVLENIITAPMMLKKLNRASAVKQAKELLSMVGLQGKLTDYPDELSGGQQQRIAIVRTLAMKPEIILFDEPTSALDPGMVDEVLAMIRTLAEKNYTMIIVTHEMRFAENVSDRIFFMNDGIIYEEGSPKEIFHAPKKEATKIFINRLKTYEKTFADANIDLMKIQGEIFSFAHKQFMSSRQNMALQLIFEELVFTLLLRRHKDIFPMEMKILYDETSEDWEFKIQYGGENKNPLDDKQDISVKIVEGIIKSAKHAFTGKNLLTLR